MRMISFIEAVLVMIAFMLVFLVLLADRATLRLTSPKLVPAPVPARRNRNSQEARRR